MLVDLHTHSTFSDGRYTPTQLVKMAAAADIKLLAITDHDSVNGMEEAMQAAQTVPNAPQIVNGVEMGSQAGEYSVHILGYNNRGQTLTSPKHGFIYASDTLRYVNCG